jgi:Ca-activated chloride channel homolog
MFSLRRLLLRPHSDELMSMRTVLLLVSISLAAPAFCQTSESEPLLLGTETTVAGRTKTEAPADLKVNVNMALIPVTVLDEMGRSVTGLTPQNFRVYDNSHPVSIATFARQDQPVAVGLVFDCSRSMSDKFRTEREAPRQLFQQLEERDESFLVTVSEQPELRVPLTTDLQAVSNALLFTHPNGTTPLLDAVRMGLGQLRQSHLGRKAMIVVSDGGDNNSRYTLHQIEDMAEESDTQIFTILLYNNPQAPEEVMGPDLLDRLAKKTGGVNFVIHNIRDIHKAMAKIGVSLHNQYVLGYYVPDGGRSGQYRKVNVQLLVPKGMPPLLVRAREGYYAP